MKNLNRLTVTMLNVFVFVIIVMFCSTTKGLSQDIDLANNEQQKEQNDQPVSDTPDISFVFRTDIADGKLAFVGVGGKTGSIVNPTLHVKRDQFV
jgi:hypothetical protein